MKEKIKIFEVILVLLAIILSVFWFLDPAGNYEPALALIGFIFTSSEIYRRTTAVVEQVVEEGVVTERIPDITVDKEGCLGSGNPTSEDDSGVSVEDILAGIDSKKYTGIQITQFVKRNTGLEVVWRVKVHDIKAALETNPESDLFLVFSPASQVEESLPRIMVAVFDRDNEADLSALSSGDIAVIRGVVSFSELAGKYSLTLTKSELVSFYKSA